MQNYFNKVLNKANGIALNESNRWGIYTASLVGNLVMDALARVYNTARPPFQYYDTLNDIDDYFQVDSVKGFGIKLAGGAFKLTLYKNGKAIFTQNFNNAQSLALFVKEQAYNYYR